MRVISLRSKAAALAMPCLVAAVLLAVQGYLSLRCGQEQYGRLLLAKSTIARSLSPQQVEEFCQEEFLVTYEIERQIQVEAHNFRLAATLITTNSCYAQIAGYRLLNGGFFSAAAEQAGSREAVLNEAAAFQLFGGQGAYGQIIKMEGASWLVVGVLDDGDRENPRVYAPASVAGGSIDGLLVLLDDNLVNVDYAKNGLKQLGVYDSNYTIVDLAAASAAFGQRLIVSLQAALILIILLLLQRCAALLSSRLPLYRDQLKQLYLREVLSAHRSDLAKTALAALAFLCGIAALLVLGLQILTICLGWPKLLPPGHAWAMGSFENKLAWLHTWHPIGVGVFALLLVVLAVILALAWRRKRID
jgi:hypothetical protein